MARNKCDTPSGDYEVGRGKPPTHSRFKPGQSGNPGGRKRGSRNVKTVLEAIMSAEIELTENGQKRTVDMLEALIKRQAQDALRGDHRALKDLLDRYERHAGGEEQESDTTLEAEDRALLQRVMTLGRALNGAAVPARKRRPTRRGGRE